MFVFQYFIDIFKDRRWDSFFGLINSVQRDNVVYWKEPKGRSKMISNATNPLKESQKESLLGCAGYASIYA